MRLQKPWIRSKRVLLLLLLFGLSIGQGYFTVYLGRNEYIIVLEVSN